MSETPDTTREPEGDRPSEQEVGDLPLQPDDAEKVTGGVVGPCDRKRR